MKISKFDVEHSLDADGRGHLERLKSDVNNAYERDEGELWKDRKRERVSGNIWDLDGDLFVLEDTAPPRGGKRYWGCVLLKRSNDKWKDHCLEFGLLYVDDELKGKGYARALVNAVEEAARAQGAKGVELSVWRLKDKELPQKARLIEIYQHFGYEIQSTRPLEKVDIRRAQETNGPVEVVRMVKTVF